VRLFCVIAGFMRFSFLNLASLVVKLASFVCVCVGGDDKG
jgi:membrane protein YqaA with SNARE-associated domain